MPSKLKKTKSKQAKIKLRGLLWLPLWLWGEKGKIPRMPIASQFIKVFSQKKLKKAQIKWPQFIGLLVGAPLVSYGIGAILNAVTQARLAAKTKRMISDFYLKHPELKDIPISYRREALNFIASATPHIMSYPGLVINFVKTYHTMGGQLLPDQIIKMLDVEARLREEPKLPAPALEISQQFVREVEGTLGKELAREIALGKESEYKKYAALVLPGLGAILGLLVATKIKKIPTSMIWPYIAFPFGGYLLGRIAEQYLQRRIIPPISAGLAGYPASAKYPGHSAYYYG